MLKFKPTKRKFKKTEEGMAIIESIPVLFMMVLVFNFSLGFFGAIHSGILNSIGSYNYAIETFRFRSNLMYFRPGGSTQNYKISHNRVHGTLKDGSQADADEDKDKWAATVRSITFNYSAADPKRSLAGSLGRLGGESERNFGGAGQLNNIWTANSEYAPTQSSAIQTPRIWIKTVYGICVTADCGDTP